MTTQYSLHRTSRVQGLRDSWARWLMKHRRDEEVPHIGFGWYYQNDPDWLYFLPQVNDCLEAMARRKGLT